jgi:hypothetical protein
VATDSSRPVTASRVSVVIFPAKSVTDASLPEA